MKKFSSMLLSLVVLISLLAGCTSAPAQAPTPEASVPGAAAQAEVPTVRLLIPTLYNVPTTERQNEVSAAVNEYLDENGYPFHLQLDILGVGDWFTQPFMALAAGEEVDLWMPFDGSDQSLQNQYNNGYVLALDAYLDNELKDTMALPELQAILSAGQINGTTYAIPAAKGYTLQYCFLYNKDIADELGLDMESVKSLDDLTPIFAQVKSAYPDLVTVSRIGSDTIGLDCAMSIDTYYQTFNLCDSVSLLNGSATAENYFASDAFREATSLAWASAGYTDPDASANPDNNAAEENLFYSGQIFSTFGLYSMSTENVEKTLSAQYGRNFGCIALGKTCNATNLPTMGIGYTCKHPSEAAQMLNLMYTDEFVINTIFYGIEGKDYFREPDGMVSFPEGVNLSNMEYGLGTINGMYGNQFITYPHKNGTQPDDIDYMRELVGSAVFSPAYGFVFDTTDVAVNSTAVANVIGQYHTALISGDVDPEIYLPEFLDALEAAGVDEIVSAAQTQLDAYMKKG